MRLLSIYILDIFGEEWTIAKMPYPAEATLYQCNHDIIYNRGIKKRIGPDQEIVTQIRQYSKIILNGCKQFYWSYWKGGGKGNLAHNFNSPKSNRMLEMGK